MEALWGPVVGVSPGRPPAARRERFDSLSSRAPTRFQEDRRICGFHPVHGRLRRVSSFALDQRHPGGLRRLLRAHFSVLLSGSNHGSGRSLARGRASLDSLQGNVHLPSPRARARSPCFGEAQMASWFRGTVVRRNHPDSFRKRGAAPRGGPLRKLFRGQYSLEPAHISPPGCFDSGITSRTSLHGTTRHSRPGGSLYLSSYVWPRGERRRREGPLPG